MVIGGWLTLGPSQAGFGGSGYLGRSLARALVAVGQTPLDDHRTAGPFLGNASTDARKVEPFHEVTAHNESTDTGLARVIEIVAQVGQQLTVAGPGPLVRRAGTGKQRTPAKPDQIMPRIIDELGLFRAATAACCTLTWA